MDTEQVRAEMRATRDRIDRKLDLLQSRVSQQRGQAARVAVGGGALISTLDMWAKLRQRQQRKRARAHLLARAQGYAY